MHFLIKALLVASLQATGVSLLFLLGYWIILWDFAEPQWLVYRTIWTLVFIVGAFVNAGYYKD